MTLTETLHRATINEYTSNGRVLFHCGAPPDGKAPKSKKWPDTPYDPLLDPATLPDIYGTVLTDTDCIVDYDPRRNTDDNPDQLRSMWTSLGLPRAETFIVQTGSGGLHIYLTKPPGLKLHQKVPGYPAIDLKTRGGYVIAAGSNHVSGNKYVPIRGSLDLIMPAPKALLELVVRTDVKEHKAGGIVDDSDATQYRFKQYAFTVDAVDEGKWGIDSGSLHTVKVAMVGRDYGLSESYVLDIMADVFNPRCIPEMSHAVLAIRVRNAYEYSKNAPGSHNPHADYQDVAPILPPAPTRKQLTGVDRGVMQWYMPRGIILPTLANITNYFNLDKIGKGTAEIPNPLLGLVYYNTLSHSVEFDHPAPWHSEDDRPVSWTNTDTAHARLLLDDLETFHCSPLQFLDGLEAAALLDKRHPLRDWLKSLVWDGKPRLDRILIDYCGAEDIPIVREFGKNTLIAAVARIMKPGCQHDSMLILEGVEGIKKSTFARILGGEWYADIHLDPHNKDTASGVAGKWILECSEMEFSRRTEVSAMKRFLTLLTDRVRPAYKPLTVDFPRQFIFIGTVNEDGKDRPYLQDGAGKRRFWPVAVMRVDGDKLSADRNQLFAEAMVRYHNGEKHYITDEMLLRAAHQETAKRVEMDAWQETIEAWINRAGEALPEFLRTDDIAYGALNLPPGRMRQVEKRRIVESMLALGFVSKSKWCFENKDKVRCWVREDLDACSEDL